MPFDEGLAVEPCELYGHDGFGHHLLIGVGWRGDDGRNVAVLEPVKVGFDWLAWVPRRGKQGVVGNSFCRGWCAIDGAEGKENVAWVVIAAVDCGADDVASGRSTVSVEGFGHGDVEGRVDGPCYCCLCLPGSFLGIVCGFGVTGGLGIEANGRWGPGLGAFVHGVADFKAYSVGCSARLRKPHSSDCEDWRVSRRSKRTRSRARMLACEGRGWRLGNVPIVAVAVSKSMSNDGGAMAAGATAAGGAMLAGPAGCWAAGFGTIGAAAAAAAGSIFILRRN